MASNPVPSRSATPPKGSTVVATGALDDLLASIHEYCDLAVAIDDDEREQFNAAEAKLFAAYQQVRASMVVGF